MCCRISSSHYHQWVEWLDYLETLLAADRTVIILADRLLCGEKGRDNASLKGNVAFYDLQWGQPLIGWSCKRCAACRHAHTLTNIAIGKANSLRILPCLALGSVEPGSSPPT
jgi:hypothetical protein